MHLVYLTFTKSKVYHLFKYFYFKSILPRGINSLIPKSLNKLLKILETQHKFEAKESADTGGNGQTPTNEIIKNEARTNIDDLLT